MCSQFSTDLIQFRQSCGYVDGTLSEGLLAHHRVVGTHRGRKHWFTGLPSSHHVRRCLRSILSLSGIVTDKSCTFAR